MKYIKNNKIYNTKTSELLHKNEIKHWDQPSLAYEIYRSKKNNLFIVRQEENKLKPLSVIDSQEEIKAFLIDHREIELCLELFPGEFEEA